MGFRFALAVSTLVALASTGASAQADAYHQGVADWQSLQAWVDTQSGDRRAGADFWAANRSRAGHKSCEQTADGFSGNKADFIAGCQEAKQRLDPIDAKRKSDSEYRVGFNDGPARLPLDTAPRQDVPAATISDDYRRMLRAWLDDHEYYPEAARQRGEQGRVGLRFRVDRSGRVIDYAVISSSGYPDLDAAVDGMMKGATLPPFPASMSEPEIDVSVNIGFGLQADAATPMLPPAPQPAAPASADPTLAASEDDDVAKVVRWMEDIEHTQGIGLPSYSPQPPFASRESARAAAYYLFYAVEAWARSVGAGQDQAAAHLSTALINGGFAQLYASQGDVANARTYAREAIVWIKRTQALYDHH